MNTLLILGQNLGICEVRSQIHCLCVCVCICPCVCSPLLPFHVSVIHTVTHIYCGPNAQAKTLKLRNVSMNWKPRCTCLPCPPNCFITVNSYLFTSPCCWDQTTFSACVLQAHKVHVHATGCNSPWCFHSIGYDLRFPILSLARGWNILLHSGPYFPMWLRVKDAVSISVKVPDNISLLSVCTLAMREWGPGTVSAQSHSNLEDAALGTFIPTSLGVYSFTHQLHTHAHTHAHTHIHR